MLSRSVVSDSLRPHGLWPIRLLYPSGFSRQEYWSGLPCPPPEIFPTQGWNPDVPHCRRILYSLSHQGSPKKTLGFRKYGLCSTGFPGPGAQDGGNRGREPKSVILAGNRTQRLGRAWLCRLAARNPEVWLKSKFQHRMRAAEMTNKNKGRRVWGRGYQTGSVAFYFLNFPGGHGGLRAGPKGTPEAERRRRAWSD